ncbi:MAG: hypothetical protein QNK37_30815 [Acidobacteriota bacterium]|nr:hypothetical protein [Acidobacteriota bacterium]
MYRIYFWIWMVGTLQLSGGNYGQPLELGKIGKPINEASGLVASRRHADLLWTHNDSGDGAKVYAIKTDGTLATTFTLKGVKVLDCEDIAVGPGPDADRPYLYLGDTGNNLAHSGKPRPHITVYRFPEPDLPAASKMKIAAEQIDHLKMTYPEGARDVETLLVDPLNGDIYLLTKRDEFSRVYRAAAPAPGNQTITLEHMGDMRMSSNTAGDVSPDGTQILIKDYLYVARFDRNPAEPLWKALVDTEFQAVPSYITEPQGEAIAFDSEGKGFYTLSEARGVSKVTLYYYPTLKKD